MVKLAVVAGTSAGVSLEHKAVPGCSDGRSAPLRTSPGGGSSLSQSRLSCQDTRGL